MTISVPLRPDSAFILSPAQEARAMQLHTETPIFIVHDHELFPDSLEKMRAGGVTAKQIHICVDGLVFNEREAFYASRDQKEGYLRHALVALDYVHWLVDSSQGQVIIAYSPDDIVQAKAKGQIALVIGAEGPRLLEDRLEVLRMLHRLGLRHLQLSWAWEASVGASQNDKSGRGLSDFGRDVIREMNRLGVIVDVSHLSYQSIRDALAISSTPIINSHTGASSLNSEQAQLLPDELLLATAQQGGVLAIHFMSQMVKPGRHKATFAELMRQFEYVVNLVGAEYVACGPDYLYLDPRIWQNQGISEPFTFAEGAEDMSMMANVTRGLVALGLSDVEISGIMGGNLLRVFQQVQEMAATTLGPYVPAAEGIGVNTGGATPL